ncbi:hypothetical protein C8Q76DRAFT_790063 [Earliella scabrosa]|nr:hypothetical protein C8Q76DRAFT_790063 [Earliella scabrosa]
MSDLAQYVSLVETFSGLTTTNYCGTAALALLLIEYFSTCLDEVDLFWRRKWTGASVLFFTNRYSSLIAYILNDIGFAFLTPATLAYILWRDGTIYFICLLILNILHLLLSALSAASLTLGKSSNMILFTEPVTAILMSRFMLNSQHVDSRNRDYTSTLDEITIQNEGSNSILFQRMIGSLGSSVTDESTTMPGDGDELEFEGDELEFEQVDGDFDAVRP